MDTAGSEIDARVVRHGSKAVARRLSGEEGAVLLHLDTAAYHGLDPVGATIWDLIPDEGVRLDELVAQVRVAFPDAPENVSTDVQQFVEALADRGLIEVDTP